jgi:2-polyprenyl-3-methyl-5-hydroxy-6-metoxy-1,4-benzoquinol methylase
MKAEAAAQAAQASTYFANERPEVAALLPSGARHVIEVGCGEGRFAGHLRGRESYWGVEPSVAAERARERLDTVLRGTWDEVEAQIPARHFDLAVCNDVIEHMPEPEQFLASLKTKLVPGAVVVGSVPNVRYLPHLAELLWQRDWRYTDVGILDRTHLRFFTQTSLERLFTGQGFGIERLTGLNDVLALAPWPAKIRFGLMQRLLELLTWRSQHDARHLQIGFRWRLPR